MHGMHPHARTPENQVCDIVDGIELEGMPAVPDTALGTVLFAHGRGSHRHRLRNNFVAKALRKSGLANLLIGFLSRSEDLYYPV